MADQNDPNATVKIDRAKRELIRRRNEVKSEIESLTTEISSAESQAATKQLQKILDQEVERQKGLKKEIEDAKKSIRDLRVQSRSAANERNLLTEQIREGNVRRRQYSRIANDKDASESERKSARSQITQINEEQDNLRLAEAKKAAEVSRIETNISNQVGITERAGSDLSYSRRIRRTVGSQISEREANFERLDKLSKRRDTLSDDMMDYEERRREKLKTEATNLTPGRLRGEVRKDQAPDTNLEVLRAGASIRGAGGTSREVAETQQATREFLSLFEAIKSTKKALAELEEGTEEQVKTQAQLNELQEKASKTQERIDKIERDVEKRKLTGGSGFDAKDRGLAIAGGIARFGSDAFSQLGQRATERYVLEEEKKQAAMRLQFQAYQDVSNRTNDATSFLATGGGRMFGAEMPWDRHGNVNGAAANIGKDYSNTRRAIPQYALAFDAIGGMADLGRNVLAKGVEGAGINGVSGATYAAGEAIRGGGSLAANIFTRGLLTSEVGGKLGGQGMMNMVNNGIGSGVDAMSSAGQFGLGGMLEWGGGNRAQGEKGVAEIAAASKDVLAALPRVLVRAYEATDQMNELVKTEQTAAQASRIRERLSMSFAPAIQQYMDAQDQMGGAMRSRSMTRKDREDMERRMEMFSLDEQLGDRGFGVNEIMANTSLAAHGLGRFGAGGMNERVAKSGMLAESMGLGGAAQNIQAMSKMKAGGVDDPEALFTKAVREGLQLGLSDSRQFQELLDAAQTTSDGVGDLEGALRSVQAFAGSGRANDVATASAMAKTVEERMSGKTGTWRDMVKFDVTNKAAQRAIDAAKKQGIDLTRSDQTSLQNLANLSVDQFDNEEMLNSILTSGAKKAISASGMTVKQYGQSIKAGTQARGALSDAVNATQDRELAEFKEMAARQDFEGIKRKYGNNPGKLRDLIAMAGSGASATGDAKEIAGTQQFVINAAKRAGIDTTGMGMQRSFSPIDMNAALDESGAARTGFDARRRGAAMNSQSRQGLAMSVARDGNGNSTFADEMFRSPEMFDENQSRMIKAGKDVRTAEVADDRVIKPIDEAVKQMVEGLKEIKEAFKGFDAGKMVVNATQDIVIQGAQAIKGVVLGDGLKQAATAAGEAIADAVKGAVGGAKQASFPGNPAAGPAKSTPPPP